MTSTKTIYTIQWRSPEVPDWQNSYATSSPHVAERCAIKLAEIIDGEVRTISRPAGMGTP